MLVGKKGYYILRVLLFFAFSRKRSFNIRELSGRLNISEKVLEQVLLGLKKKRILSSKRGPRGGYTLIRDVGDMNIDEVFGLTGEELLVMPGVGEVDVIDMVIGDMNMGLREKICLEMRCLKINDLTEKMHVKVSKDGHNYMI